MTDIFDTELPTVADTAVTLRDLLQSSELYREWFRKPPKMKTEVSTFGNEVPHIRGNWRVAVLTPKGWRFAKMDFTSYAKAANVILHQMRRPMRESGAIDFALNSRRQPFNPPVRYRWENRKVKVKEKGSEKVKIVTKPVRVIDERFSHEVLSLSRWAWCPYCRRPTRWGYFRRHHALPRNLIIPYQLRCSICGASSEFAKTARHLT